MTLVGELQAARRVGFGAAISDAKYGRLKANPYSGYQAQAWDEGYFHGESYVERERQAAKRRAEASARRERLNAKLIELFGGSVAAGTELRDELEAWIAEMIDARTRS